MAAAPNVLLVRLMSRAAGVVRGGRALLAAALFAGAGMATAGPSPIIDVHLHFNWDQAELIAPDEALRRLDAAAVPVGVVSGVPSDYAQRLRAVAPDRIIALFSPYLAPGKRWLWHRQPELVERTRAALAGGEYQGIGEMHLQPGGGPRLDDPVLNALLELAAEFDRPALIHTDTSSHAYLLTLCQRHPDTRILWAHAGGKLPASEVDALLAGCPNVWAELSARDPWRYDSLADEAGQLPDAWRALIMRRPERFMIGSDPVWNVRRTQRWDTADEGWDYLAMLLDYHRRWLASFPPEVVERLQVENARAFFGLPGALPSVTQDAQ